MWRANILLVSVNLWGHMEPEVSLWDMRRLPATIATLGPGGIITSGIRSEVTVNDLIKAGTMMEEDVSMEIYE